jgi:hypothetical protein
MGKKYQGEDVVEFVTHILSTDVLDPKNTKHMAIVQDLVDAAKLSIAKRHVNTVDKQYRAQGKMIGNKNEVVKVVLKELNFASDDLLGAIVREYGIKL